MNAIHPKSSPNRPEASDPVALLARELPMLWALSHRSHEEARCAKEENKAAFEAEDFKAGIDDRIEATEDMICCLEATSLTGAAAQIMLVLREVGYFSEVEITATSQIEQYLRKTKRLCRSALSAVMKEAGLAPRDIAADQYGWDQLSPFPPKVDAVAAAHGDDESLSTGTEPVQ